MAASSINAKSVADQESANTAASSHNANGVAVVPSVPTADRSRDARSVADQKSANTAVSIHDAKSVAVVPSVPTADRSHTARTVAVVPSAPTADGSHNAKSVAVVPFVPMADSSHNAKDVAVHSSVATPSVKHDPRTAQIRTKSKEILWVNAILQLEVAADYDWVWDKPLYVTYDGGCCNSKRRIDIWTVVGGVVIAVEIDENQHAYYKPDYEANRYNDLFMDFSARFIFLRINPDHFAEDGIRRDPAFEDRLIEVERKLAEIMGNLEEFRELVEVYHLFYSSS